MVTQLGIAKEYCVYFFTKLTNVSYTSYDSRPLLMDSSLNNLSHAWNRMDSTINVVTRRNELGFSNS